MIGCKGRREGWTARDGCGSRRPMAGTVHFGRFAVVFRGCGRAGLPPRVRGGGSGGAAGGGSAGPESFDGVPGAVEPVQGWGVADQPNGDAAGPAGDHGGDEDDAVEEAAELHADVVV